jgi:hypothetical protein
MLAAGCERLALHQAMLRCVVLCRRWAGFWQDSNDKEMNGALKVCPRFAMPAATGTRRPPDKLTDVESPRSHTLPIRIKMKNEIKR